MGLTIIDARLIRELLPMAECIERLILAMSALSNGEVVNPARLRMAAGDSGEAFLLMPSRADALSCYGAKLVTLHPANTVQNLPAVQGLVTLFDASTGAAVAILDGGEITAIRTAAASGLATQVLSRENAKTVGIFGTGVQAQSHIDAMTAVRSIEEVVVWARDPAKAQKFAAAQASRTGLAVRAASEPSEAGRCDIVCTVTGSATPIFDARWLRPGTHLNVVGAHRLDAREVDTDTVLACSVYVDSIVSCRGEAGDLMIPIAEGAMQETHIKGEIGQVLNGVISGRKSSGEKTLYKSLGVATQDLFAAQWVYEKAVARGLGVSVDF